MPQQKRQKQHQRRKSATLVRARFALIRSTYCLLLAASCCLWGKVDVALAAPQTFSVEAIPHLRLAAPRLLSASQLSDVAPHHADPIAASPPQRRLDGFGLAVIGALGGGVALSTLTLHTIFADGEMSEAARTAFITSLAIGALGTGGWSILRTRNGPLTRRRRIATMIVFAATYATVTGAALVWGAFEASSD